MSRSATAVGERRKPGPSGTGTRERLVAAATRLFGARGYEGVGAREIAAAAKAPLAAIPYHFGTKQALYRAVLAKVASGLQAALAAPAEAARAALAGSPDEARRALAVFQGAILDVIAVNPAAETWAKLLLREHLDPSEAYDLAYESAAKGAVELIAALIGRADGLDPDDESVLIRAFAAMGEVLMFRVIQTALTRRLDWMAFGPVEADRVRCALGWDLLR